MSLTGEINIRARRPSAPGSNQQIIFNTQGVEGTSPNLTYDFINNNLNVGGNLNVGLTLSVNNFSVSNLIVTQNANVGNISATGNVTGNNLVVVTYANVGNITVTQNTTTGNLTVIQNLIATNFQSVNACLVVYNPLIYQYFGAW